MARPSKSVRVKTGAIASDVEAVRQDVEDKLRGENVPPEPPGRSDGWTARDFSIYRERSGGKRHPRPA